MRIPNRFIEHPIESMLAGALLLLLLLGSAGRHQDSAADRSAPVHPAGQQKL